LKRKEEGRTEVKIKNKKAKWAKIRPKRVRACGIAVGPIYRSLSLRAA
jgi:hypothetical protein